MTDVRLVKDCGLYPSYKKIIDFTGTKSEIIAKQLTWIDSFNPTIILNANYNKFQNKLVLEMDYEEALTYTYAVMTDITGAGTKPMFFFINEVENLTNGIDDKEPNVAINFSLDPIMTYMGDWRLDECLINRTHLDRWEDNKPKRITPNKEGIIAFNKTKNTFKFETNVEDSIALCVMSFTSPYIKTDIKFESAQDVGQSVKEMENSVYCGAFLVDLSDYSKKIDTKVKGKYTGINPDQSLNWYGEKTFNVKFPSFSEVISGDFQSDIPVVDNAIVSFTLTPASFLDVTKVVEGNVTYYIIGDIPQQDIKVDASQTEPEVTVNKLWWMVADEDYEEVEIAYLSPHEHEIVSDNIDGRTVVFYKDLTDVAEDVYTVTIPVSDWHLPTQPQDGDLSSPTHEPALYMQPYVSRKVVKGDGTTILEIPDVDYTDNKINVRTIITANGISTAFIHGNENIANISEGELGIDNSVILDVVNDEWKTYIYTKRDTDRQMVSNYAWKNAIDNLIYMTYGGTLVGSRSMGKEGLYNKGNEYHLEERTGKNGRKYKVRTYDPPGLTASGRRVVGASAVAAGASIITSLVDAHVAWENQLQKEKQIRNEPSTVLNIGDGIETVLSGYKDYYFIVQQVDEINYDIAYENFRKYGYLLNKFGKPDIHSRKYFNYILTNGAIINGAINQDIRDVIASIFDAGVTIFHYDSEDETTRNLEYTDKENIEVSLTGPMVTATFTFDNVTANHTIHAEFTSEEEPEIQTHHTFDNVTENHTIHVEFEPNE